MNPILVIEDEEDILNLVKYQFEQSGYSVATALNGTTGLEKAKTLHPALVILDLMLPDIDGKDLCRALKTNPLTQTIPILMLTAKTEELDRIVGFELGAEDYVTKPFSPRELVLRAKAILRRKILSQETEKLIQIGDLLIDIDKHKVLVKKKLIRLTPTEFRLLVELTSGRGRVFTRENLLDRVWGYTYEGYARTVDTHIRSLREKLGIAGKLIETVRGVGYRFQEEE